MTDLAKKNVLITGAASGIGFETALALEHGELPASLHYRAPNPEIDFRSSPFFVNAERRAWAPPAGYPRRAGVSSLGVGGTNAHVILQQPPAPSPAEARRPWRLVPVSAKTDLALDRVVENLARHLREHPDVDLDDTAYTLQEMLTVKSDDVGGRNQMYKNIVDGNHEMAAGMPESFNVLVKEIRSLGINIELEET